MKCALLIGCSSILFFEGLSDAGNNGKLFMISRGRPNAANSNFSLEITHLHQQPPRLGLLFSEDFCRVIETYEEIVFL
ncbi:hypothetical protein QBC36DRAFT_318950 [Triangularia setosa]|uniref:Secreted protein n=1 Tax=Triangularia setosa TaxID=2587417 RepID=A0AAN6WGZ2_9PEZI|nr:hypothetical protein QBC36DRAFT_318950 [Podospora setosa]